MVSFSLITPRSIVGMPAEGTSHSAKLIIVEPRIDSAYNQNKMARRRSLKPAKYGLE
jgi:hypothetical protein